MVDNGEVQGGSRGDWSKTEDGLERKMKECSGEEGTRETLFRKNENLMMDSWSLRQLLLQQELTTGTLDIFLETLSSLFS